MIAGRRVLAVVPARSGSKGIPHKNMREVAGRSLIARVGDLLRPLTFIDRRVISTDSPEYAAEGEAHGLDAPFLRPAALSTDGAGAVETVQHAVLTTESLDGVEYDVVLIVEPSSPLRTGNDIESATRTLVQQGADSVVTVSELPTKAHPHKVLTLVDGRLAFYDPLGASVQVRQQLSTLYWRNGVCYAVSRECLMVKGAIFGENSVPQVTHHVVVNIDEPWELEWAEFLLERNPDLERGLR